MEGTQKDSKSKKVSSYQKLKQKHYNDSFELISDIKKLINGTELQKLETKFKWQLKMEMAEIMFDKTLEELQKPVIIATGFYEQLEKDINNGE